MTLEEQSTKAGILADRVGMCLLSVKHAQDPAEKRKLLVKAFHAFSTLARNMSALEQMAPNSAREGFEEAAKIADFIEGRAA